jgi:hypothetical protein
MFVPPERAEPKAQNGTKVVKITNTNPPPKSQILRSPGRASIVGSAFLRTSDVHLPVIPAEQICGPCWMQRQNLVPRQLMVRDFAACAPTR